MAHISLEDIGVGKNLFISEVRFRRNKRQDYVKEVFAANNGCYDILSMAPRDWTTVTLGYYPHMTTTLSLDGIWACPIK